MAWLDFSGIAAEQFGNVTVTETVAVFGELSEIGKKFGANLVRIILCED